MSLPEKFLSLLGRKKIPHDRRRTWARDDRETVAWEPDEQRPEDPHLSRGERSARLLFSDLITGTPTRPAVDPVTAIREALELSAGHIPAYETRDQFDAFWSYSRLVEISNTWRASRHFEHQARSQVRAAHARLGAASDLAANVLVDVCQDTKASKAVRVKAAQTILGTVGIIAGSKIEDTGQGKNKSLKDKGKAVLGNVIQLPVKTGTDGA